MILRLEDFDAAAFDYDLTLADSTKAAMVCVGYALEQIGSPPTSVRNAAMALGLSWEKMCRISTGDRFREEMVPTFRQHYLDKADEVYTALTTLMAGSKALVELLSMRRKRLGIVSNNAVYRIDPGLTLFGIRSAFTSIIGRDTKVGERLVIGKPHPESVQLCLAELGVKVDRACVVGDSENDVLAARAAGVRKIVLVLTGPTRAEEVEPGDDLLVVNSLDELRCILST